jgi:hypothetical protein
MTLHYIECRYAEFHYAECCIFLFYAECCYIHPYPECRGAVLAVLAQHSEYT